METGAAVEKSVGRRGGQREAGKLGRRGWGGGVERGSRCQRPAVYVAYLLVHCRAILSCSALLVRYWVAMLPTRGSAERREGKKERRTEREKKSETFLYPGVSENTVFWKTQTGAGKDTERERESSGKWAIFECKWKSCVGFNRHICHVLTQLTQQCQRCLRQTWWRLYRGFENVSLFRKVGFPLLQATQQWRP